MGIVFAVRGQTSDAYYASGYHQGARPNLPAGQTNTISDAGAIGGSALLLATNAEGNLASGPFSFDGRYNLPTTVAISILIRFKTVTATGNNIPLFSITPGGGTNYGSRYVNLYGVTNGSAAYLNCTFYSNGGAAAVGSLSIPVGTYTQGVYHDLVITWSGATGAGQFSAYYDGALVTAAASAATQTAYRFANGESINLGVSPLNFNTNFRCNEFVIWDEVLTAGAVASFNGDARAAYVSIAAQFWGSVSTGPAANVVLSATGYTINGETYTGSYSPPVSTGPAANLVYSGIGYTINDTSYTGSYNPPVSVDPGIANVLSGTGYTINNVSLTGTYHDAINTSVTAGNVRVGATVVFNDNTVTGTYNGSDLWSDPLASNVRETVTYLANGVTQTGLVTIPDKYHVRAGVSVNGDLGLLVLPTATAVLSGTAFDTPTIGYAQIGTYHDAVSADPGIANVLSGTGYTINDASLTGTYHNPLYSSVTAGIVETGRTYIYNDTTVTGTLVVAGGVYTSITAGIVENGKTYVWNSVTATGSRVFPAAAAGSANTVDLNAVKENLRYIFDQSNTTTASPVDLSYNLVNRVAKVLKVEPSKIPIQASFYPYVTVYVDGKNVTGQSINVNQLNEKREAEVTINVVGCVYCPITSDVTEDPADEDLENLMENIEKILRAYHNLGGTVTMQRPRSIQYHSARIDHQTHIRAAILALTCKAKY